MVILFPIAPRKVRFALAVWGWILLFWAGASDYGQAMNEPAALSDNGRSEGGGMCW
jgi:hypothetical protein